MQFYTKFIFIPLLLFSLQITNAQHDTLTLNHKCQKFEFAVIPATLYLIPNYFKNKTDLLFVYGLQGKFYTSTKNAVRVAFALGYYGADTTPYGAAQYEHNNKTKQYSVGFQQTFFNCKKISTYWFTDFYYQTFSASSSTSYINTKAPPGYIQGSYDSTLVSLQQVNSFNLVAGIGFKFLDRKHVFVSAESGLGVSYYIAGVQQVYGFTSSSYSNHLITSTGAQQTVGPDYNSSHQLPMVETKTKGLNLNGSLIRLAVGFIF